MNFTIARKLYFLILGVILGLVFLTATTIQKMHRIHAEASYASVNVVPSLLSIAQVARGLTSVRVGTWKYLAADESYNKNEVEKNIASGKARIVEALTKYEKVYIADDSDRRLLNQVRGAFSDFMKLQEDVMALAKTGNLSDAKKLLGSNQGVIDKLNNSMEDHRNYNEKLAEQAMKDSAESINESTWYAGAISTIIIIVVATTGLLISRKIVSSISEAVVVAEAIASGDLTRHIAVKSKDEIGMLMLAMAKMNTGLIEIVSNVRTGVDTIASASNQIAMGNRDLSSRTEAQASSLEETAAATEELTSTVKQNADNASQANQLAVSASAVAIRGGEEVGQVVSTMNDINTSSAKIVDIINVIDGIAFQTNILALNAAVEAARAGEQGRGFAVVASEVRNLAQRSATAAKEIKQLIDDSVKKVDIGSKLVQRAGETMEQVVHSVKHVTDVVSEISSASLEQSTGIEQVNQAIGQMDQVTQENAALVEQATAAAQSLQQQAQQLEKTVGAFKLASEKSLIDPSPHSSAVTSLSKSSLTPTARKSPPPSRSDKIRLVANSSSDDNSWEQF